jgi:hypothetical protein
MVEPDLGNFDVLSWILEIFNDFWHKILRLHTQLGTNTGGFRGQDIVIC